MVPIKQRFDDDDHYDGGNTHEFITVHDTGNKTDSDEGNANYFCTGTRNASANYFVDDDSITQVVRDTDGAFHCGDGHGKYGITNRNSIGIEMCRVNGIVTAKTEANCIDLVKLLMAKYKVPASKVVRHYDASRKICPQSMSTNNWARWWAFKAKLTNTTVKAPTQTIKTIPYPNYYIKYNPTKYDANAKLIQQKLGIGADGYFGNQTKQAVINFQSKNGLGADAIVGSETWNKLFN